ncbi:RrF2 family transcriptional regulator [Verrucomicrobiota bacterium]
MKLSTKPRYGLRILLQIAVDTEDGKPAGGKDIAKKQDISTAYMEQILIPLRNAGVITAVRGRHGGYLLNRPAEEITVLDIIEIFEGKLELVESSGCDTCDQEDVCPTREVWNRLSSVLREESAAITVADLAEKIKKKTAPPPDYII